MSINIDKKGRVHLYIMLEDENGVNQRQHFSKPEWKIKRDAKKFEDEFMLKQKTVKKTLSINNLYGIYIEKRKMKNKSSYNYASVHRQYIKDSIGLKDVAYLTQDDIRKWQDMLLAKDKSPRYTDKIQDLLRTILRYGVSEKLTTSNPFTIRNIEFPVKKKVPVQHWSVSEFEQFEKCAADQDYKDFFTLLFWEGLRYGEAVALTVEDCDPIKGTIVVDETWDAKGKEATDPKTVNSFRTIVCTNKGKEIIARRLKMYSKLFGYDKDTILFGFHTHLNPTTTKRRFEEYIKASGVKRIIIHALRHSHVAFLRGMGWSAFDIAKRLGHTVEMVDEVYGQWNYDRQREMMDKLNETMAAEKEIKEEKPVDSKLKLVRKKHFIVKESGIYQDKITQIAHSKNMN